MNTENPKVVIDRKQNLTELCGNVCQQHNRFRRELLRAREQGVHLIFLVEHGEGIECLEDVYFWENPRRTAYKWVMVDGRPKREFISPNALTGETLYKTLNTIAHEYDVEFLFCQKEETGRKILEVLGYD